MIQRDHQSLSLSRQCTLLGLSRSALYYTPLGESAATLTLLRGSTSCTCSTRSTAAVRWRAIWRVRE